MKYFELLEQTDERLETQRQELEDEGDEEALAEFEDEEYIHSEVIPIKYKTSLWIHFYALIAEIGRRLVSVARTGGNNFLRHYFRQQQRVSRSRREQAVRRILPPYQQWPRQWQ